jgi:hypothetical protein
VKVTRLDRDLVELRSPAIELLRRGIDRGERV